MKIIVTLSKSQTITIHDFAWPLIASAYEEHYPGRKKSRGFRCSEWSIRVYRNDVDGRVIVAAAYSFVTSLRRDRACNVRHGMLLSAADATPDGIVSAIRSVSERMAACEHYDDDAERWSTLADDCIVALPTAAI